jgi:hypothetical protein
MKQAISFFTIILILCLTLESQAQVPDKVTTYQDENGWKLQVNGKDYYVKGVVWGYTPIGENYAYNLWGNSDAYIKKVLDYECDLMKKAGINTIRSFGIIPPRWVTYIYQEHGIMTVVNHLMGRYGYMVGGIWRPFTDYSDELTRETLKNDIVDLVSKYKDTPGVIMFALGNESNYGLEWSSFEIEDLPVGEQHKEKAKYLYSLFNGIIHAGKQIDQNHLFTIVNGDIQYIELIKEHCKDLDILGVNSYRGISFTDLWKDVKQKLDLPVLFMEFGSDAFNAVDHMEDQAAQAHFMQGMWKEIYNKSYGKGEEGLAIGGFVFEWRDEWWKYRQTENLYIQDDVASWANGGYYFDYVEGRNNMNEEWFGICRLSGPNADGVSEAQPRAAYNVLTEIWRIDPYSEAKAEINRKIDRIDMKFHALEGDVRLLKSAIKERDKFRLSGGSLRGEIVIKGKDSEIEEEGEEGLGFTNGEMLFMDFDFQPSDNLKGSFTLNILGNVADKEMETFYGGERGQSYTVEVLEFEEDIVVSTTEKEIMDNERVEIYDFEAVYNADYLDFITFYHVPRYHWGYEGDFYGLLRETTDMAGEDIWNAKAPFGWEFIGKKSLDGLKVVVGPEVYWGANPKAIIKYTFGGGHFNYSLMHSEDIARADVSATDTEATERQSRQTTLYVKTDIIPRTTLEIGGIMAATEKVGDEFDYLDGNDVVRDEIEFNDTLGIKAKATVDIFARAKAYAAVNYSGLVADGGEPLREFGTELPYSEYGNKIEYEGGILFTFGDLMLYPRVLYRENLIDANPSIEPYISGTTLFPGIDPRNRDDDPFAVLDNREALSGELFLTYDPTPATSFYAWDNDKREDSPLAFNIGANVTQYDSDTDAYLFFYEEGGTNASFGEGLPDEEVWKVLSRIVLNPTRDLKIITNLEAGFQQSTGAPDGDTREYYEIAAKMIIDSRHIVSGYVKKDAWGPYDWYQQFNITYPWQMMLDYSMLIDNFLDESLSSRIGIKGLYRTLDEDSPADEYAYGVNEYMFEISAYYIIEF